MLLGSQRASFVQSLSARPSYCHGHSLICGAVGRSYRAQGSLITVAVYLCSKHYQLLSYGRMTLALCTHGLYIEHIGKDKTKFYSSSINIYSLFARERACSSCVSLFSHHVFLFHSTQKVKKRKNKAPTHSQ